MARRFSDIKRAARLSEALTGYKAYLDRPVSTTLPTYKARPNPVALQISPFGFALPTGSFARVNGNPSWTTINAVAGIAGATSVAVATTNAGEINGFTPARVIWFRNATKTVTQGDSKFTNQPYRKYEGERLSMPFGQLNAADREFGVGNSIKTALKAVTGFAVNRVSITPERNRVN